MKELEGWAVFPTFQSSIGGSMSQVFEKIHPSQKCSLIINLIVMLVRLMVKYIDKWMIIRILPFMWLDMNGP